MGYDLLSFFRKISVLGLYKKIGSYSEKGMKEVPPPRETYPV